MENENPHALNYSDIENLYICLNKAIMFKKPNKLLYGQTKKWVRNF